MLSYCISIRFCNLCQHSSWKREWSIIILVGIFIAPWIINIWQQQHAVQSESHQSILQFTFPMFVILLYMDIISISLANESWFNFVFGILEQSIDLAERHRLVWCVWSYILCSLRILASCSGYCQALRTELASVLDKQLLQDACSLFLQPEWSFFNNIRIKILTNAYS